MSCVCEDKDEYTCYYLRYAEVFHEKFPGHDDDPEIDEVLFDDSIYCTCLCHAKDGNRDGFFEGWLTKNDIRPRDVKEGVQDAAVS